MKFSASMIFLLFGLSFGFSQEIEPRGDQWGVVRADTYTSVIDGKSVVTRVSPQFIDCGIKWIPGDKLPIRIEKISTKAESDIVQTFGKKWTLVNIGFNSYGKEMNSWIIQLIFQSEDKDIVVMLCNLRGEIWTHGKVYDEFD